MKTEFNARRYMLIDPFLFLFSFVAAYGIREFFGGPIQEFHFYFWFLVGSALLHYVVFFMFQLYRSEQAVFSLVYLEDFVKSWLFWGALVGIYAFFSNAGYSRAVLGIFFLFFGTVLYLARFFIEWYSASRASFRHDPKISRDIKELVRVSKISSESLSLLEGLPLRKSPGILNEYAKRVFDVLVSSVLLFTLWPFFILIALLIRADSRGKIIFGQERVGKNGSRFVMYKFRTMRADTPLYASAPRHDNDPRVTAVGKMLRKYSLDELPQLWNVLQGNMSMVGPRPEMPFIVDQYEPWQKVRLEAKPGITGLWQIFGRKDLPLEENLEYDFYYIYHRSFFLDAAIILKTIPHLIFPRGAY